MRHQFACAGESGIVVIVHGKKEPTDTEWDDYIDLIRGDEAQAVLGQLVYSLGGGPNAKQRARALGESRKPTPEEIPPCAVMTSSAAVRAIILIFSWVYPNRYKRFAPDDLEGAAKFMKVPPATVPALRATLARLKRQVNDIAEADAVEQTGMSA